MRCPFCGGEMQTGAIKGQSFELAWFPEGKGPPKLGAWSKTGISLGPKSIWQAAAKAAYYCERCKKIVLDV